MTDKNRDLAGMLADQLSAISERTMAHQNFTLDLTDEDVETLRHRLRSGRGGFRVLMMAGIHSLNDGDRSIAALLPEMEFEQVRSESSDGLVYAWEAGTNCDGGRYSWAARLEGFPSYAEYMAAYASAGKYAEGTFRWYLLTRDEFAAGIGDRDPAGIR